MLYIGLQPVTKSSTVLLSMVLATAPTDIENHQKRGIYMLKIREYRKQKQLTIKELAALTDMSISYISQIERGEIDPSLSALQKIAGVFQIPLYLLLDDMERSDNLTIKKEQQPLRFSEDQKVSYRFLTPLPSPRYSPEALLIEFTLAPHSQDVPEPVRHHSEELIYVTEGDLTIQIGDSHIELAAGDTTVIQKDFPHICKNLTDRSVTGIAVFSPPVWGRMDLTQG